ncbi:hypothetical protein [Kitasatospora sp. Ki12]
MPHSTRITGVRHLGQQLQQTRNLPSRRLGLLAELVKGSRNRG